jgi:hypothetical protein
VLACPISHFRGGALIVTCPTCREHREVPVDAIIARIGAGHSVKAVVEQLRCSVPGCGAPPCGVGGLAAAVCTDRAACKKGTRP